MRRAVVIGSNGPSDLSPLRYAARDAEGIGQALSGPRCGFQIVTAPAVSDAFAVKRLIIDAVEACEPQDTFLLYFSGHGVLDKGSLFLLWDNTSLERLLGSALPVAEIMNALAYCRAENKLFVLDCCHAGAAISGYGFKDASAVPVEETVKPENFLVLMASKRLERARELDELQGGFLAFNIRSALTESFYDVVADDSSRLSVQQLKRWLEQRAREYNRSHSAEQVPVPYLFGQQKGELFLTIDDSDWITNEVPWSDGSSLVVLPIRPDYGRAFCLAKFPVTNGQYKTIIGTEPEGEHFVVDPKAKSGKWTGPFHPWQVPAFAGPDQPVVCVSYQEAQKYARAVNSMQDGLAGDRETFLPTTSIWDFAAFGTDSPPRRPKAWMSKTSEVHHQASSPAAIDIHGARTNGLGLADMIGNVWEWCAPGESPLARVTLGVPDERPEVRGGSYLDDVSRTPVSLTIHALPERERTRHSDLGFRIAGSVPVEILPETVQIRLALAKRLDSGPGLRTPATA